MRSAVVCILLGSLLILSTPAAGGEKRIGVGAGYVLGSFESDALPVSVDSDGFSIFGSFGFSDHWGLLVAYRDMEDDEALVFDEKDTYTILGVNGSYRWRTDKRLRPYAKFGLALVDFESEIPGFSKLSDDAVGLSLGGGLEAGSAGFAFFLDLDVVEAEFQLGAIEDDLSFFDMTLGFIYRF